VPEAAEDPIQSWRLPAREIEDCAISVLIDALTNPASFSCSPLVPDLTFSQPLQPFEVQMGSFGGSIKSKPMDERLQGNVGALTAVACELHHRSIKNAAQFARDSCRLMQPETFPSPL
jgi:hypothetical protein